MLSIRALSHFLEVHQYLALFVLALGVVLEGEFVLIMAGIMTSLGGWDFYIVLIFGLVGAVMKTFVGYGIGLAIRKKFPDSKFLKFIDGKIRHYLPHFKRKPFWSIFISKFLYGINHFTLIFAGYCKVKFKTYFNAELLSSVIWVLVLISLGYFFSHTALDISRDIRKFFLIIFGFILGFIVLERILVFIYELIEEYAKQQQN